MKQFLIARRPARPPAVLCIELPRRTRSGWRAVLCVLALGALCASAFAATYTWNTTAGDWTNGANWTPSGPPNNGDDVVITNSGASVILSSSSSNLASLTLSKTLTFTNWNTALTATNITIASNGVMTLPAAFTNDQMSNRVWMVCSNLLVASGGSISTDGKGYKGAPAASGANGNGPGYGQCAPANYDASGAGHGGKGGDGGDNTSARLPGGVVYDSTNAPTIPGSGGGASSVGVAGGNGGGAVLIDATGAVTVNGAINANGTAPSGNLYSGGGSGGSIYITCNTFAGTFAGTNGVISAAGGNGETYGGGGGGGRIAVAYNPAAQTSAPLPSVRFSVMRGNNGPARWVRAFELDNYFGTASEMGTLYFPDTNVLDTTFMPHSGNLIISNFTSWAIDSLTISNGTLQLVGTGFNLVVSGNILITGSTGALKMVTGGVINCGGNLVVTNGGALYVYGAVTNSGTPDYGSLVSVTGDISVASNSWVYPYSQNTNGGSPLFRLRSLMIATNGGFNANAKGFDRGGNGATAPNGLGPGYGYGSTAYRSTGAGYGGRGGRSDSVANRGTTYGLSNAPVQPGSSGGGGNAVAYMGARGGGLIRVEAGDTIRVDGTLTANAGRADTDYAGGHYGGGGAGGGIYLRCRTFAGSSNGVLRANGGDSGWVTLCGAGGGGRIAVWRIYHQYQGSYSVTNGIGNTTGTGGNNAEVGTMFWGQIPVPGAIFTFH